MPLTVSAAGFADASVERNSRSAAGFADASVEGDSRSSILLFKAICNWYSSDNSLMQAGTLENKNRITIIN